MKETNTHNDNLTLETMTTYRIQANAIDSNYEAESEEEALEAYAKDAGYNSYEEVVEQFGEVDSIEEVEPEITESGKTETIEVYYPNAGDTIDYTVTVKQAEWDGVKGVIVYCSEWYMDGGEWFPVDSAEELIEEIGDDHGINIKNRNYKIK